MRKQRLINIINFIDPQQDQSPQPYQRELSVEEWPLLYQTLDSLVLKNPPPSPGAPRRIIQVYPLDYAEKNA